MTESCHRIAAIREEGLIVKLPHASAEVTAERLSALIGEGKRAFSIPAHRPGTVDRVSAAVSVSKNSALIGATGVTDSNTARAAILAGAEFVLMPYMDIATVRLCRRYQKICIPGTLSVTEILLAIEIGCDLVGLYPAQLFGPQLLKAVKGPLPQANLVPSGGIGAQGALEWIQAGAAAVEIDPDIG